MKHLGQYFTAFVLQALKAHQLPCSDAAVQLLVMIAAHESDGFRYVRQLMTGPARGLLQMEPIGLAEVQRYMNLRPEKFRGMPAPDSLKLDDLIFDSALAVACARVYLMSIPDPLPLADDIDGLASYAKRHWNTHKGKAYWRDYADAYRRYCG